MKKLNLLTILFLMVSCQFKNEGPYNVKIPVEDDTGRVSIQVVELKTLEDPDKVESSIIKVKLNSRVYSDGYIHHDTPRAQYILTDDNIIIPKDATTGQLFSLYKNMEELYFLDKQSGVFRDIKYPRVISLQTKELKTKQSGVDNSTYNSKSDVINVFKNSEKASIPLSFQRSIIAHEHFHAIMHSLLPYDELINESLSTIPSFLSLNVFNNSIKLSAEVNIEAAQKWNFMILKSIEEGLADFWAFNTFGKENLYLNHVYDLSYRNIDGKIRIFESEEDLENGLNFDKFLLGNSAQKKLISNNIENMIPKVSNLVRRLALSQEINGKPEVSSWIVGSIKRIRENKNFKKEKLKLSEIFSFFIVESANKDKACGILNEALLFNESAPECK